MFKYYLLLISNTRYLAEHTIFSSNWSRSNDQILASLFQSRIPIQQSWLRDVIFRDPGIWDRDFSFWAGSKNHEIPGIGVAIRKSRNPGDRDRDLKIPKKNPKFENPKIRCREFGLKIFKFSPEI